MSDSHALSDRLRARARQLGLPPARVADLAGVNRSFVYDILRGRSARPDPGRLGEVARVLKVDADWLTTGAGEGEGPSPLVENPDDGYVAVPHLGRAGAEPRDEGPALAFRFRRGWIRDALGASPSQLRIMRVAGDGMAPTLLDGDALLVDLGRRAPNPPGLFVLDDGLGLVAKRLEHVPNSDPPSARVISDNALYAPYERATAEIRVVGRVRWFARAL
jgi:phage repressor protein C with HTH and peptisase S24 domain